MAVNRIFGKRTISLYKLFLQYLAAFCLTVLLLAAAVVACAAAAFQSGFVLQANYAERAVGEARDRIARSETFDRALVPFPCTYILIGQDGTVMESDMTSDEIEYTFEKIKALVNSTSRDAMHQYALIERADSLCVVCYDMYVHFASPVLDQWLPRPELLAIFSLLALFLADAFVTAVRFGRRLKRELEPIIDTVDRIAVQELDLDVTMTGIWEFNTVLHSIREMGEALERSLKEQWELEQEQRVQIASVAHDIKIPLTVVKGNAELLLEEELSGEDREVLESISAGADRIEKYIGLLCDAAWAENAGHAAAREFVVAACIGEIRQQAAFLCRAKDITLTVREEELPETFYGDQEVIVRAVSNILDNAVEYTPGQGAIELFVSGSGNQLLFQVTDSGKGFSDNSLKYAARQFYTECGARSGKHYGLGLYMADKAAQRHGGRLVIANRQDGDGAVVTLTVRSGFPRFAGGQRCGEIETDDSGQKVQYTHDDK